MLKKTAATVGLALCLSMFLLPGCYTDEVVPDEENAPVATGTVETTTDEDGMAVTNEAVTDTDTNDYNTDQGNTVTVENNDAETMENSGTGTSIDESDAQYAEDSEAVLEDGIPA